MRPFDGDTGQLAYCRTTPFANATLSVNSASAACAGSTLACQIIRYAGRYLQGYIVKQLGVITFVAPLIEGIHGSFMAYMIQRPAYIEDICAVIIP